MDKQYYKRPRGTWRRHQNGNTHRLTQNDTKKNIKLENARPWWNTWLLVQDIHLHSRQTTTRNEEIPIRRVSTWMEDQRKDYINPKGPKQRNCSKPLQTNNLPTNDVENTNSTNKRKDLLLANKPRIVPWRTERMPQRIQTHSRIALHRSTHPKWEQDKTEKYSYGPDWLKKGIWYGPTKLDNTLPQNVQNITWSHTLNRKDHEDLESGADSRRKSLEETKIQRGIFHGDALSALLFLIAMMPLNPIHRKCAAGYKLSRPQEKINHLMYMDDIKLFAKNKKELETLIHAVSIHRT